VGYDLFLLWLGELLSLLISLNFLFGLRANAGSTGSKLLLNFRKKLPYFSYSSPTEIAYYFELSPS
jgi:hypothetical protein